MEPSRNNPRARAAARKKAAIRRRRRQAALRRMCVLLALVLLVVVVGSILLLVLNANPLVSERKIEAGSGLNPEDFLKSKTDKTVSFVTDLSELNLKVPGKHEIEISVGGKTYTTTVVVVDTVAPKAEAVNTVTKLGVLPDPDKLVTNIEDAGPVTVSYQTKPEVSKGGETKARVLLTDAGGNTAVVEVQIVVITDETPPVIAGAKNREFFIGDSISYKEGVTVTDDKTETPILTVDNSAVRPQTPGTYPVIYTAKDAVGNETTVTVYFTIKERPSTYVEPEVAYEYARVILNKITNEDMTKAEVAAAIYNWVKKEIRWDDHSDKESGWPAGAVYGFVQRKGDCFTYYAAAKALLDVAGIPNIDVVKVVTPETSQSSHYWNLIDIGDGWYHMDCTPRNSNWTESFFLFTDEEMLAYSRQYENCFNFDLNAYPERATRSLKEYIRFSGSTQKVSIIESW